MNIIGKSDEVFLRLGVEEMDEPRLEAEPHRRVAGVGVGVEVRGLHHGHHVLAAGGHVQMQLAAHQLAHVDLRVDALVADGDMDRCMAAMSTIRRELGTRWMLFVMGFQCVVAWVVAFIITLIL